MHAIRVVETLASRTISRLRKKDALAAAVMSFHRTLCVGHWEIEKDRACPSQSYLVSDYSENRQTFVCPRGVCLAQYTMFIFLEKLQALLEKGWIEPVILKTAL